MFAFNRTTAIGLFTFLSIAAALCTAVNAAPSASAVRQIPAGPRVINPATPPPLPGAAQPLPWTAAAARRPLSGRDLVRITAKRPPAVALRDALARTKKGGRHTLSASGATITLLGDHNAYAVANQPQIADFTLGWGEQVGFDCSNLTPSEANLNWIIFPPDGSAFINKATVGTDAFGNCQNPIQDITLSTPYGSGTDAPYAGVWAVGLRKPNGDYEAVTYFVVTSEPQLLTYSDGALSRPTRDFTTGQTMYVVANGLNPADSYAIGFVQTSVSPLKCVFAVPSTFAALPNCFAQSVANAGVGAASGSFEASWDTSVAPAASGSYSIQLYDVTQHHLIATQQVALQGASVSWTLTPYQGVTNGTTGLPDFTYAFDGFLDQAVTGLTYGVSGLPASGTYVLTVTDPNGAVLTSTQSADGKHVSAPGTVTVGGGTGTSVKVPFALNAAKNTALGPTQLFNAATTLLAQLYDPVGKTVLAAKSFTLLGYSASAAWNGAASVNAAPGGSCQAGYSNILTVTNTSANYGSSNGDGIVGIRINADAGGNATVCATNGSTTATDTGGNLWTITYAGGSATATINGAKPAALAPGQSVSFAITVAAASSACGGPPCALQTQILPLHGLAYSANNAVTNGLLVGGKNNTSVPSNYAWAVTGPSPGAGIVAPPSFTQMMYVSGTNGALSASSFYTVTATIQNNNSAGNANTLNDVRFTFPSNYNFAGIGAPTLLSLKTQAGTAINGWSVFVPNGTSNNLTTPSTFAIANGTNNSVSATNPIQPGTTVIATLKIPMPANSFPLQQIPADANFDGGCIQVTGTKCTYAGTPLNSAGTQNSVAGPTNVDSTELGVYSLDTSKMSGAFTPQTIGAGVATSSTFTFTNTPTSADPNPDWIDQITLTFPTGAVPASVTAPAGWTVTSASPTFTVTLNPCTPTPCQETNAIAPGGNLALTVAFPSGTTAGTYDGVGSDPPAILWTVRGANGGTTTPSTTAFEGKSKLVISPVSASVKFAALGGYPTGTTVSANTEPTVGSDANGTYGNAYDYRITNNGSQTITDATITIPVNNRAGAVGTDSGNQNWQVVGTPIAGSCAVVVTQVTTGTTPANGSIVLSGCSLAPGASLDVTFDAKAPYQIGSEFDWLATVCAVHASCATLSVGATPQWSTAEYVKIVVDARLSIIFSNGAPLVGAAPALPNPGPGGSGAGGSTPTTSCPACSITSLGATPVIDVGSFNGTATLNDLIDASVTSDVSGPNAWSLYISIDANPLNGASAKEFSMKLDSGAMIPLSGLTIPAAVTSFFQPPATGAGVYPTAASGTLLGTYTGSAHRLPIDTIHSFQINNTGATGAQAVTLMWTLIAS
ncbi:MAG: hypothetical protein JWN27_689 [Candidatus Eremiobacteraeota bacterium]|nr:hypothetical protein [Candidatus Eremiobacteraeota bacterium]